MADKIITPEGRVSFPSVFEARAFADGADAKFGVTLLFDKDSANLKSLRDAAIKAVIEKWGPDKAKWPVNLRSHDLTTYLSSTGKDGWPFRDGDVQGYDGYENAVSVKFSSKAKPGVVDRDVQPIINQDEFYAGCYARVQCVPFAFDASGNKGVTFMLNHVQKVRDGEAFSGRGRAEDAFTALPQEFSNDPLFA